VRSFTQYLFRQLVSLYYITYYIPRIRGSWPTKASY